MGAEVAKSNILPSPPYLSSPQSTPSYPAGSSCVRSIFAQGLVAIGNLQLERFPLRSSCLRGVMKCNVQLDSINGVSQRVSRRPIRPAKSCPKFSTQRSTSPASGPHRLIKLERKFHSPAGPPPAPSLINTDTKSRMSRNGGRTTLGWACQSRQSGREPRS